MGKITLTKNELELFRLLQNKFRAEEDLTMSPLKKVEVLNNRTPIPQKFITAAIHTGIYLFEKQGQKLKYPALRRSVNIDLNNPFHQERLASTLRYLEACNDTNNFKQYDGAQRKMMGEMGNSIMEDWNNRNHQLRNIFSKSLLTIGALGIGAAGPGSVALGITTSAGGAYLEFTEEEEYGLSKDTVINLYGDQPKETLDYLFDYSLSEEARKYLWSKKDLSETKNVPLLGLLNNFGVPENESLTGDKQQDELLKIDLQKVLDFYQDIIEKIEEAEKLKQLSERQVQEEKIQSIQKAFSNLRTLAMMSGSPIVAKIGSFVESAANAAINFAKLTGSFGVFQVTGIMAFEPATALLLAVASIGQLFVSGQQSAMELLFKQLKHMHEFIAENFQQVFFNQRKLFELLNSTYDLIATDLKIPLDIRLKKIDQTVGLLYKVVKTGFRDIQVYDLRTLQETVDFMTDEPLSFTDNRQEVVNVFSKLSVWIKFQSNCATFTGRLPEGTNLSGAHKHLVDFGQVKDTPGNLIQYLAQMARQCDPLGFPGPVKVNRLMNVDVFQMSIVSYLKLYKKYPFQNSTLVQLKNTVSDMVNNFDKFTHYLQTSQMLYMNIIALMLSEMQKTDGIVFDAFLRYKNQESNHPQDGSTSEPFYLAQYLTENSGYGAQLDRCLTGVDSFGYLLQMLQKLAGMSPVQTNGLVLKEKIKNTTCHWANSRRSINLPHMNLDNRLITMTTRNPEGNGVFLYHGRYGAFLFNRANDNQGTSKIIVECLLQSDTSQNSEIEYVTDSIYGNFTIHQSCVLNIAGDNHPYCIISDFEKLSLYFINREEKKFEEKITILRYAVSNKKTTSVLYSGRSIQDQNSLIIVTSDNVAGKNNVIKIYRYSITNNNLELLFEKTAVFNYVNYDDHNQEPKLIFTRDNALIPTRSGKHGKRYTYKRKVEFSMYDLNNGQWVDQCFPNLVKKQEYIGKSPVGQGFIPQTFVDAEGALRFAVVVLDPEKEDFSKACYTCSLLEDSKWEKTQGFSTDDHYGKLEKFESNGRQYLCYLQHEKNQGGLTTENYHVSIFKDNSWLHVLSTHPNTNQAYSWLNMSCYFSQNAQGSQDLMVLTKLDKDELIVQTLPILPQEFLPRFLPPVMQVQKEIIDKIKKNQEGLAQLPSDQQGGVLAISSGQHICHSLLAQVSALAPPDAKQFYSRFMQEMNHWVDTSSDKKPTMGKIIQSILNKIENMQIIFKKSDSLKKNHSFPELLKRIKQQLENISSEYEQQVKDRQSKFISEVKSCTWALREIDQSFQAHLLNSYALDRLWYQRIFQQLYELSLALHENDIKAKL